MAEKKKLWKTKTFWGGLATILTGVGLIMAGEIPSGVEMIGFGVIAICGRDAVRKVENK